MVYSNRPHLTQCGYGANEYVVTPQEIAVLKESTTRIRRYALTGLVLGTGFTFAGATTIVACGQACEKCGCACAPTITNCAYSARIQLLTYELCTHLSNILTHTLASDQTRCATRARMAVSGFLRWLWRDGSNRYSSYACFACLCVCVCVVCVLVRACVHSSYTLEFKGGCR